MWLVLERYLRDVDDGTQGAQNMCYRQLDRGRLEQGFEGRVQDVDRAEMLLLMDNYILLWARFGG